MEKGFKDIENYFLSIASDKNNKVEHSGVNKSKKKIDFSRRISVLNEKIRGKDEKIKKLFAEIGFLRERIDKLEKENLEFGKLKRDKAVLKRYTEEIAALKAELRMAKLEIDKKNKKIELLQSSDMPKSRIELFIEVALSSVSAAVTLSNGIKILFSKRFRKDVAKEVSCRPFLFEGFISALSRSNTTSKLLKRGNRDIYRIRVTSMYGEYRAIYIKLDKDTVKFHRFGQRDSIYKEFDGSGWSFD